MTTTALRLHNILYLYLQNIELFVCHWKKVVKITANERLRKYLIKLYIE